MRFGRWLVLGLALVGCLALAACGSSKKSSSSTTSSKAAATGGVKQGGTITIVGPGPDSFDPQLYQTSTADAAMSRVYVGLLAFKDATGTASTQLVPALADNIPQPTNGGKTYTFHMRQGVKYSDGEPVRASDVVNMVKRDLFLGGPFSSFFAPIVGSAKYTAAKKPDAPLEGMKADDATGTLTINLSTPDTRVLYAFAIGEAGIGPKSKAIFKNLTGHPFPGAGPYQMQVVSSSTTNGKYVLTRNPNFNIPTLSKGNVDKIIGLIGTNVNTQVEDVINNKADYFTEDPAGDLLPQVETKYKDRFLIGPGYPNTYYFFMNVTIPPFNKLQARQAVNYAIDSRAIQRIFGGRLSPSCNLLPPAMVGYKPIQPCPWGDPAGPGNIAKAKQLVQQSGTAGQSVTVWTDSKDPRPQIGDYLRSILKQIGYKVTGVKTLAHTVYFSTVGNPKTKSQIGFTDWFQDFPHPGDFFGSLLTTDAAKSVPSFNEGFVSDPKLDKMIADADAKPPQEAVADWEAIDKYVNDPSHAYVAPYGNEEDTALYSTRINVKDCSGYPNLAHRVDWSLLCLK